MPIVKVELFPGRSPEKKAELAKAITDAFERIGGITPAATTVIFVEFLPTSGLSEAIPCISPQSIAVLRRRRRVGEVVGFIGYSCRLAGSCYPVRIRSSPCVTAGEARQFGPQDAMERQPRRAARYHGFKPSLCFVAASPTASQDGSTTCHFGRLISTSARSWRWLASELRAAIDPDSIAADPTRVV